MSSVKKLYQSLPSSYAQRASFKNKRALAANINKPFYDGIFTQYEPEIESILDRLSKDLKKASDANKQLLEEPKPIARKKKNEVDLEDLSEVEEEPVEEPEKVFIPIPKSKLIKKQIIKH